MLGKNHQSTTKVTLNESSNTINVNGHYWKLDGPVQITGQIVLEAILKLNLLHTFPVSRDSTIKLIDQDKNNCSLFSDQPSCMICSDVNVLSVYHFRIQCPICFCLFTFFVADLNISNC